MLLLRKYPQDYYIIWSSQHLQNDREHNKFKEFYSHHQGVNPPYHAPSFFFFETECLNFASCCGKTIWQKQPRDKELILVKIPSYIELIIIVNEVAAG